MKPLSKRQREMLQRMKEGGLIVFNEDVAYFDADEITDKVHGATFRSIKNNLYIERDWPGYWRITKKGLTALAKPTRNRGKKQKPVIENAHEKIMV